MKKKFLFIFLLLSISGTVAAAWRFNENASAPQELTLFGNVDLRQVALAFNNSERITAVLVQEGDRVRRGEELARLDTGRLEPQVAQITAQVDAQRQLVKRLRHGTRPEEIAQDRARVGSANAEAANARRQYLRLKTLSESSGGRAIGQQDVDNAKAALDVAEAKLEVSQKALDLAISGPRKEDIEEATAQLRAKEAQLALLQQQHKDASLLAPVDAIVRSRLMEPGEMASPQKPALMLAITDPKWVRAYVSEPDLSKVHSGMPVTVKVDGFPDRRFEGWVGFVSPVAEFTPKAVQTEELRTSLVYQVRAFVKDPDEVLRLGMPATVLLPLIQDGSNPRKAAPPAATP